MNAIEVGDLLIICDGRYTTLQQYSLIDFKLISSIYNIESRALARIDAFTIIVGGTGGVATISLAPFIIIDRMKLNRNEQVK
jgi:hypothetical protein